MKTLNIHLYQPKKTLIRTYRFSNKTDECFCEIFFFILFLVRNRQCFQILFMIFEVMICTFLKNENYQPFCNGTIEILADRKS